MAVTNIHLLANKIEALDAQAQHAVEIAVDSLLDDAAFAPNGLVDSRIATLERRVDVQGDQSPGDDVVFLDEYDRVLADLTPAIGCLINTARRTIDGLVHEAVAHARAN